MMIKSSNESDLQAGAAGINSSTIGDDESKALSISSSSTAGHTTSSSGAPWLRLKDPRIVRVSRAFGGKDRHSKVTTVRGLRDRRVRLSVPTAIQLYDLQDRLGLNQPSKVVDWLLTAAKHEIDELPPLPNIPPPAAAGPNFGLNLYHPSLLMMMSSTTSTSHHDDHQIGMDTANDEEDQKQKDHMSVEDDDHDDHQKQQGNVDGIGSSSNIHHHHHPMFFPGGLVNNAIPAPNYGFDQHNWEAHDHEQSSNFPVSHHLASHGFMTSQSNADHDHHHLHNFNVLPSTLSLSTGSQTQSYFPNSSHNATTGRSGDQIDPRHDQFNHIQMLSSSTSLYPNSQSQQLLMRAPGPHLSMMRKLVHEYSSHNTGSSINDEPNKDQLDSPSK